MHTVFITALSSIGCSLYLKVACMDEDLVAESQFIILLCVHGTENICQKPQIRCVLFPLVHGKDQAEVLNAIGWIIMFYQRHTLHFIYFIVNRQHLFSQVLSGKKRNTLQCLRAGWLFLVYLQLLCFLYQFLDLFRCQSLFVLIQFFLFFLIHLGGQSCLWLNSHIAYMSVVQEEIPDQLLIIICIHGLSQFFKHIPTIQMDKRLLIIIQPAVKHLQAVHQSLWIVAEISLSVLEFHGV